MASTSPTGIYQPEGGDAAGLAGIWKSQNDSLDQITTPQFATTAARDAAVTAITGRAGSPPPFRACYITGLGFQTWTGTLWQTITLPSYRDVNDTSLRNVTTGAWTLLSIDGTVPTAASGDDLFSDIVSPIIRNAGVYRLDGFASWAGGAGRRILGFSTSQTAAPSVPTMQSSISVANGQVYQPISAPLVADANTRIALWAFQDSGATVGISTRRIFIQKIG